MILIIQLKVKTGNLIAQHRKTMKMKNLILFTLISCVVLLTSATAAPSVSVTLEPKIISLNSSAKLTVSIRNVKQKGWPELPDVEGLIFSSMGQSSQMSAVNGNVTSVVHYSYRVTADKEGEYQVPAISIQDGGKQLHSKSLTLKVSAPQKNVSQSNLLDQEGLSDEEKKKTAFLTIQRADSKGRKHLYVGESTPVLIRAYFRTGLRVSGIASPSISSDAFTLSALSDEPEQEIVEVDGFRYHALNWYGNLSGIKAGDYDLKTELEAVVGIPSKHSFNDPVFDSFFTSYENKDLLLHSDKEKIQVLSPPLEGRPDSFSGAVGQYEIKANSFPSSLEVGEAVTLEVYIEGKGNFDRVNKPTLMPENTWKVYKEKMQLERGDIVDFHARKHFSIPAVVTTPGEFEAFFQFNYFDPETEEYKTIETVKSVMTVKGEAVVTKSSANQILVSDEVSLPAIKEDIGSVFLSHTALYQKTWFKLIGGVLILTLLGCAIAVLVRRYRGQHSDFYSRREMQKEHVRQFSEIQESIDKGEVLTFFRQCRAILQKQIALDKGGQAEAITMTELLEHYPSSETAIAIFRKADEVEFTTQEEPEESMDGWLNKTRTALEEIQNPSLRVQNHKTAWGQVTPV